MAPVRGRVEDHMLGAPFDTAFEHRFQRLVEGVVRLEGKIVAEQDEALGVGLAEMRKATRQRADVLAMDFDKLERAGLLFRLTAYRRMHSLDEGAFARAACAPTAEHCWREGPTRSAPYCRTARRACGRCP
jgi:hypothetical protein